MSAPSPLSHAAPTDQPLWTPDRSRVQASRLAAFADIYAKGERDYHRLWIWSNDHPEEFWSAVWDFCGVVGHKGDRVLVQRDSMQAARFFPDARLNYAENLLKHRGEDAAIIARNEKGGERTLSWDDLHQQVAGCRAALAAAGIQKGDRVAGLMPNIPETVIAMLATASLGAIWSSASPDFGDQGIMDRFGQIEPRALITVDGYFYNGKSVDIRAKVRGVVGKLPSLNLTIVVPFASDAPDLADLPRARLWTDIQKEPVNPVIPFEPVSFDHPLVIMFSSGTTGIPKCIVHGHGGTLIQHLKEHELQCDVKAGDRVFYFTTCGWMMWNWLITALACRATLLLFDGSPFYPSGDMLWDFAARYRCTLFGTSAKYIDTLKAHDIHPGEKFDLSSLRTLTSTGSPLVHESFDFVYQHIKHDLHLASIYGGTDIIAASFGIGNPLSPVWRGELQGAGLGTSVDIFDEAGKPMTAGAGAGELVCTRPFPSMPVAFWNDPDGSKYRKAYFEKYPGVWHHGDWVEKTSHHGLIVHGRSDATLNPGGVRIGTAEIYRQVEQVPEILESLAVGQEWDHDVRVILFVRLKDGATFNDDLVARIKAQIKNGASPRHVPAKIIPITDIPRTKSNKIVELAVREIIHGRPVKNSEALANPEALDLYKNLKELQ